MPKVSETKKPKAIRVSYHTYEVLKNCRYRYKLQMIDKLPSPRFDDNRKAIFGFVVQRLFERFYVEEWYRLGRNATQKLYNELPGVMREQISKHPCIWEHRSEIEILEKDCQDAIPKFIKVVREMGFIGERNQSEVLLEYPISQQFMLTGRADFLIAKSSDLFLLDGKGTKYGDKYLDEEQLLYYGVIMRQLKMRVPTKVGFWMWRDSEVKWIDFSDARLEELYTKVKEKLFQIQKQDFAANPCTQSCRFCPYQGGTCQFYSEWHRGNQRARASKRPSVELPEANEDGLLENL